MIIGETEVILKNHDLYNEDYDELWGLFDKKTPEEKLQREKERQQRKEERHQQRLINIKRRKERQLARDTDPKHQERRQALLGDIGNTVSGVLSSVIEGQSTDRDSSKIPSNATALPKKPIEDDISFAGLGGFGGTQTKKKDNTMLWVFGGLGGIILLSILINNRVNK